MVGRRWTFSGVLCVLALFGACASGAWSRAGGEGADPGRRRGDGPSAQEREAPRRKPLEEATSQWPRQYANRRFVEDWRPTSWDDVDSSARDFADRIKAIPLSEDGGVWVGFGGQGRIRPVHVRNRNFGATSNPDDGLWIYRIRTHADLHVGEHVRVFAEGIYADQDGYNIDPTLLGVVDRGDLLNGFAEFSTSVAAGVRAGTWVGRREQSFGRQRFVSPNNWLNSRKTFDGAGAYVESASHRLDVFLVNPVEVLATQFNERDLDSTFWGVHHGAKPGESLHWEGYVFGLHRDRVSFGGVTGGEDRYTVGGRLELPGKGSPWGGEIEAAVQFGRFDDVDLIAMFASAEVTWRPPEVPWQPSIQLGVEYASGDPDPDDGRLETFDQLFGGSQISLGLFGTVGRQNVFAARSIMRAHPHKKLMLVADTFAFWRANRDDASYTAAKGVLRLPSGLSDRFVGIEVDAGAFYFLDHHWVIAGGILTFFPGDFIRATGASKTGYALIVQATYTF